MNNEESIKLGITGNDKSLSNLINPKTKKWDDQAREALRMQEKVLTEE
jgi:hypothetical protein